MYLIYSRTSHNGVTTYTLKRPSHPKDNVKFFGNGLLKQWISRKIPEASCWCLDVRQELGADLSFVIDLKPRGPLEFFELLNVCGYSSPGYTPLLLRLRRILNGETPRTSLDPPKIIQKNDAKDQHNVYSFLRAKGHIASGALIGSWSPPGPSATNSALLWPDHLQCFLPHIHTFDAQPYHP